MEKNLFLLLHPWWFNWKIENVKSLHWGQVNGKQILFCFSPGFWFWQVYARGQKLTCFVFICFRFRGMQWWRLFDSLFGEVALGLNGKSGLSLHRWLSHSKRQCQVLLPKSSIWKKSFAFASMDGLLKDRHVESLYQGQVNDFFCVHSGLPQR